MADNVPPWLATMRAINGTKWAPGDGTNTTILEWLRAISATYPPMATYCSSVMQDEYFEWCGLTVAYCMTKAGIRPVFGSGGDTSRFLWAAAWLGWGTSISTTQAQPGDVVVFQWPQGGHHVTLFDHDNGDGTWSCHGGNQTHQVQLTNFPQKHVMGVRRPSAVSAVTVQPDAAPVPAASQRFDACVALVLHDEGGNDDDPRDPGGRTSRGITQSEWDRWRQTRPDLPSDVWQAPQDQIVAIYHQQYWNVLKCDDLPPGVDYVVFDYGVLSGVGRSARILQGFVGTDVDGDVGPKTIAAAKRANATTVINQISDERLTFLQSLKTWPTFGNGWTNRVQRVRNAALAMVSAAQAPAPEPAPGGGPFNMLSQLFGKLEVLMPGPTSPAPSGSTSTMSQPDIGTIVQQVINLIQAFNPAPSQPGSQTPTQPTSQPDPLQVVIPVLNAVLSAITKQPVDLSKLGQVNGALGQTIGDLLNGKKTGIGVIGSLIAALLPLLGTGGALNISSLPALAGLLPGIGQVALPIFLALGAWGVLGKLEKWFQASPTGAPPSTTPSK